jgi:Xaa-Pro aminopeptidase
VMGIINTNTLSGDAAVMAFMAGDSGVTTCRAAFGVAMAQTTPGSGFEFGIDLKMQDPIADGGGSSGVIAYTKANIRMEDDVVVMVDAGAPVNGTTGDDFAGYGFVVC